MKCPRCLNDNNRYNLFCVFCGEPLSSENKPTKEELTRQYQNKSKSELMDIAININKGWTVDAVETAKYILKSKYNEEIPENVLELYSSRSDTNKQHRKKHSTIFWLILSGIVVIILGVFVFILPAILGQASNDASIGIGIFGFIIIAIGVFIVLFVLIVWSLYVSWSNMLLRHRRGK